MAILLTPSGTVKAIIPTNGVNFSGDELHRLVDGYLECLRLRDGRLMWFDDEGKVKGKPVNLVATLLALAVLQRGDVIVGNAVITTLAEAGE